MPMHMVILGTFRLYYYFYYMQEKKMKMEMHMNKEHMLKKVWSQYTACANVYLAPVYSDCMDQMDDVLEGSVEEWRSAAGKAKNDQLQGCLLLKQSNYWWKV